MSNLYYVYVILDTRFDRPCSYKEYNFKHTPFYIGKGKGNRCNSHLFNSRLKDSNKLKVNIINKIFKSKKEPEIIILESNLSESDAFALEVELIKIIGRRDIKTGTLANLTDGGEGQSGNSNSFILYKNPFYNKTHKNESFEKYRKSIKQYDLSGNFIKEFNSLSEASELTNSIASKISMCAKGKRNHHNNYIWKFSDIDELDKVYKYTNKVNFQYIEQIDIESDEVLHIYRTIISASNELNIQKSGIIECLKGRRNTSGGFKWRYKYYE